MKALITHIAVYAADIEKTKDFYVKYFGGKSNKIYKNNTGFSSCFISFESGTRIEIMHHVELESHQAIEKSVGWSHAAFSVGSEDAVIQLTNEIVSDGYKLYSPPRKTGDGYFESCVADPDGNRIEITV